MTEKILQLLAAALIGLVLGACAGLITLLNAWLPVLVVFGIVAVGVLLPVCVEFILDTAD